MEELARSARGTSGEISLHRVCIVRYFEAKLVISSIESTQDGQWHSLTFKKEKTNFTYDRWVTILIKLCGTFMSYPCTGRNCDTSPGMPCVCIILVLALHGYRGSLRSLNRATSSCARYKGRITWAFQRQVIKKAEAVPKDPVLHKRARRRSSVFQDSLIIE